VKEDHAAGWDESLKRPNSAKYFREENRQLVKKRSKAGKRGAPWERVDENDNEIADVRVANAACEAIKRLAGGEKPFFIAAGFYKPHLPFVAPARFWEPYPVDQVRLPANFATRPDAPDVAFAKWGELRAYHSIPAKGPVSEATARELIASYRACVSFTDSQVGRLLDTLDASGAAGNSVVVLLGDHGWNLGEHGMWCKHCVFETSMRTPLLVSAPMMEGFRTGESTATLTEFVDVLPTVCELIGLPAPPQAVGVSFVPVLSDPAYRHRDAAIGRYGAGDTIRTDRYRYSVFRRKDQELGHMLYDHDADPAEDTNLVDDPAMADVVADLSRRLAEATGR
ncbi:MAG: sulfatase/phosphatase domain-containing protein, partial [Planctomycetota bacterium]